MPCWVIIHSILIYIYIYIYNQPPCTWRIWHKVNFLTESKRFLFGDILLVNWSQKSQSALYLSFSWNSWIHAIPKGISTMWNASSQVQDLNSGCRVQLHHEWLYIKVKHYLFFSIKFETYFIHWILLYILQNIYIYIYILLYILQYIYIYIYIYCYIYCKIYIYIYCYIYCKLYIKVNEKKKSESPWPNK